MTTDEIDQVRQIQKVSKQMPGIYGNYSQRRSGDEQEVFDKIASGEPYVIRLKSPGEYGKKRVFNDVIRGEVHMQEHFQDTVLLKSDGYPTYHLAHLVDDYLMGTTHVIRAEERLASVPLHVQLFECTGLQAPQYAHLAQLLKTDEGKKRKLSKRKDPEADVQ
jgi:glutamyl-tRNA synthetase